jgi:hypothetical protein
MDVPGVRVLEVKRLALYARAGEPLDREAFTLLQFLDV